MKPDVAGSGVHIHSNFVVLGKQTNLTLPKQRILPALAFFLVSVFFRLTFLFDLRTRKIRDSVLNP